MSDSVVWTLQVIVAGLLAAVHLLLCRRLFAADLFFTDPLIADLLDTVLDLLNPGWHVGWKCSSLALHRLVE